MPRFDVSKAWIILVPPNIPAAEKAAGDLARCIGLLRGRAGLSAKPPALEDASGPAPPESAPIVVLNSENGVQERNGFTWRTGAGRVEIYGESDRGLCGGIYDFLAKLGVRWPAPGREELPSPMADRNGGYALAASGAYEPSGYIGKGPASWRRFVPGKNSRMFSPKNREALVQWAARNKYDALCVSFEDLLSSRFRKERETLQKLADEYALGIEAGGWELSLMVPRRLFLFHRDLFRMEEGRRKQQYNFCPTNPGVIGIIKSEGTKYFRAAEGISVFNLWPDKDGEEAWCSCPTCRAFTPAEQNRIAVNAVADVLASINPEAFILYWENPGEESNIPMRSNLFRIECLPEEPGADKCFT
ncbi:MAG: DUF4838 domain-containing protein [Treponema sp.]|jgi:hypothetical protein|nr:DUF4838 domain-containing protein [Treponema sp.]